MTDLTHPPAARPEAASRAKGSAAPTDLRPRDFHRYAAVLDLTASLGRAPTPAEMAPVFEDTRRVKAARERGDPVPEKAILRMHEALNVRVGRFLGDKSRIASKLGAVADLAVGALREVLNPATRPTDPRQSKAVADAALRLLEIAGHSREAKPGVQVDIDARGGMVGISVEESVAIRNLRRELHAAKTGRAVSGLDVPAGVDTAPRW